MRREPGLLEIELNRASAVDAGRLITPEIAGRDGGPPDRLAWARIKAVLSSVAWDVGYLWGLGAVALSAIIAQVVRPYAQIADLVMIHLLGVLAIATRFSVAASVFTGIVSILTFDYFFIPPLFIVSLPDGKSIVTFGVITVAAAVISRLQQNLRRQELTARRNEARTAALYALSSDLLEVHHMRSLRAVALRHTSRLFSTQAVVLLGGTDGELPMQDWQPASPSEKELAARAWSRQELVIEPASSGLNVWQPLVGPHRTVGVIGLGCGRTLVSDREQRLLLAACANQVASAVERMVLAGAVRRAEVDAETERLRSSLLSAVSHDLRTPLASIITAGTTLADNYGELDAASGKELLYTIVDEAERLNDLLRNLLSVTRLEAGVVDLNRTSEAIEDLVADAMGRLRTRLQGRSVCAQFPADLPLVSVDAALIQQLLINLLENALRYTPATAALYISARETPAAVAVEFADDGPGISETEREKVFEKFYRGGQATKGDGGVGLGLTICRAIVRAHGGYIVIRGRPGGGALVEFTLPRAERQSSEATLAEELRG